MRNRFLFRFKGALRVHPAETRLTVYRRLSVTRQEAMCGDKGGQKSVTSGQNFEECENSVPMRAWFGELNEPGNIIAKA